MSIVDFLNEYIGIYTPVTYEVTTLVPLNDGSGLVDSVTNTVVAPGLAGVDWPYVLSFVLFVFVGWFAVRFCSAFFKALISSAKSAMSKR